MPGAEQNEAASAAALVAAVIELGVERLANNRPVLLGVTPAILRDVELLELTGKNVGFVILEGSAEPGSSSGSRASPRPAASSPWPTTALDPADALLPHARLAKIEIGDGTHEDIEQRCAAARAFGAQVVAGGIDSPTAFRWSHDARFDLFQGDTHSQPSTVSGRGSRADQSATLNLLVRLSAAATSVDELERIVASDLGLTVSTLHAVNSAAIALPNRITSIRQAIVLLGARAVHALAALLAMTQLSDAPVELSRRALIRASMCDALARGGAEPHPDRFFTTGMLSMAGALLDLPARARRLRAAAGRRDRRRADRRHRADRADPVAVISYEQAHFGSVATSHTVIRRDIATPT